MQRLPGGHPVTLYHRRHLHGDTGSVVEVFQHVLALGVFEQRTNIILQRVSTGPTIRVMVKGSFSPACGHDNHKGAISPGITLVSPS